METQVDTNVDTSPVESGAIDSGVAGRDQDTHREARESREPVTERPNTTPLDSRGARVKSLQQGLRAAFDQHRDKAEREEREADEHKGLSVRESLNKTKDRLIEQEDERHFDQAKREAVGEEVPQETQETDTAAPASWSKEAKGTWEHIPERARAEIRKREKDIEKGVKALKDSYKTWDDMYEYYFGKVPKEELQQGMNNILNVGSSLSNPQFTREQKQSVLADLGERMGLITPQQRQQIASVLRNGGGYSQQVYSNGQSQNGYFVHNGYNYYHHNGTSYPVVQHNGKQYLYSSSENKYYPIQQQRSGNGQYQNGQSQSQYVTRAEFAATQRQSDLDRRTEGHVQGWYSNRPHYEKLRPYMQYIMSPNPVTGKTLLEVPSDAYDPATNTFDAKKVNAYLDEVEYQAAMMHPEIRQEILDHEANQLAKKRIKEIRKEENELKARRDAGSSLTSSAPGPSNSGSRKGRELPTTPGKSVRESLMETVKELSGGR